MSSRTLDLTPPVASRSGSSGPAEEARERIFEALRGLRFGTVEIQVHESRIVRITRTEKIVVEGGRAKDRRDDG